LEESYPNRKYEDLLMAVSPSYQQLPGQLPLANPSSLKHQGEQSRVETSYFAIFTQSSLMCLPFQLCGNATSNNVRMFHDKEYVAVDQLDVEEEISFQS
jgi:hypothetical protein